MAVSLEELGNAGSLELLGTLGARDPGKDPVPAPAPRTVRGQGNRELRRPGDPGRTSQPTTRIKPTDLQQLLPHHHL